MQARNIPVVSRCPNCSYPLDQVGRRTSCAKCGRRLTLLCIECNTENAFHFHNCINCGSDFRIRAVEHFARVMGKVGFELNEYEKLKRQRDDAEFYEQLSTLATAVFVLITGIFFMLVFRDERGLAIALGLGVGGYLARRLFYRRLALIYCRLPANFYNEWPYLEKKGRKLRDEYVEAQRQHDYYQAELNRLRAHK